MLRRSGSAFPLRSPRRDGTETDGELLCRNRSWMSPRSVNRSGAEMLFADSTGGVRGL
jgi:hypothetical protein